MTKSEKIMMTMLQRQLARTGFQVAEGDMLKFMKFLKEVSPWFTEEGALTLDDWKRVGKEMRRHTQNYWELTLPKYAYQIWYLIRELLSDVTPSEGTDMLLKQLAWENANTLCQDLIRPIRKTGTINEYIKACADASPAIVQGMAYAAAMKGQRFSAYVKKTYGGGKGENPDPVTCFNCGQPGHMQRDCAKGRRGNPGICPRCKKGRHWGNECKSKFHKDGTPLEGKAGKSGEQGTKN